MTAMNLMHQAGIKRWLLGGPGLKLSTAAGGSLREHCEVKKEAEQRGLISAPIIRLFGAQCE